MTTTSVLRDQLAEIFSRDLSLAVPSADMDLIDSGLLDSFGLVTLMMRLEEEFGVRIALDELEIDTFRSFNSIAGFVAARVR